MPNSSGANVFLTLLKFSLTVITLSYVEDYVAYNGNKGDFRKVIQWLESHSSQTGWHDKSFYDTGIVRLEQLCLLTGDEIKFISDGYISPSKEFLDELKQLKRRSIFKFWLKKSHFKRKFDIFVKAGFESLQDIISKLEYSQLQSLLENNQKEAKLLWQKIEALKDNQAINLDSLPVEDPTSLVVHFISFLWAVLKKLAKCFIGLVVFGAVAAVILIIIVYFAIKHMFSHLNGGQTIEGLFRTAQAELSRPSTLETILQPRRRLATHNSNPFMNSNHGAGGHGFWQNIINLFRPLRRANNEPLLPFNPQQTKFDFSWNDNEAVVGEMLSFTVKFYSMFVIPCQCSNVSNPKAEITVNGESVPLTMEERDQTSFFIKFTPTVAAQHKISFYASGQCIKTVFKGFLPGAVDPSKSSVKIKSSIMVLKPAISAFITLDECDKFSNKCDSSEETLSKYMFTISELKDDCPRINPTIAVTHLIDKYVLMLTLSEPGCYKSIVTHQDSPIGNNEFTLIVLTDDQWDTMASEIEKPSLNAYYESSLLSDETDSKRRNVYIYLTPKQLCIKEFYLRIFPKRLHTMRVRTTLKFSVLPRRDTVTGHPLMSIKEPERPPILIACKDRNLIVAMYSQLLLSKIGGSANFESKRAHLYSELRKLYMRKSSQHASISVNRSSILKDSISATKNYSNADWGKLLKVTFIGEYGIDFGGLLREWFQLLCDSLFKPENFLFCKSGKDDAQSLIHPNPFRPESHKKLKLYEFAGKLVGKMLIECAFDRPNYVNARFSRAFLCQIIGLDVSWKHFESDDKELYRTKIEYILKEDPEDLDLTFTEDIYDAKQNFVKTVDLKPHGSQINVNESNKIEYLHLVADYRLAKCVKDEISSFVKGLSTLVPEHLLSIFDENELELLICGTEHISPLDLKENFSQCAGGGQRFNKILSWFWDIVFGFSQEEMARLLQFTTGSSQLPPGGFKELNPRFQINCFPGVDILPTAHTCFNMLCLPDYSTKNDFQKLLLVALNEGSEGFGLA